MFLPVHCSFHAAALSLQSQEQERDIIRIVSLYRTITLEPELLIADEITSALDVTIQAQIIELLNRLRNKRGLSVIFISHDLALVRSFCDQVVVFQSGTIVEQGSVSNVLEQPQNAYTQALLHSAPTP
jgi:peptide/nickel transport system ATP-binding protein